MSCTQQKHANVIAITAKRRKKSYDDGAVYLLQFMKPCYTLMHAQLYFILTNVLVDIKIAHSHKKKPITIPKRTNNGIFVGTYHRSESNNKTKKQPKQLKVKKKMGVRVIMEIWFESNEGTCMREEAFPHKKRSQNKKKAFAETVCPAKHSHNWKKNTFTKSGSQ